LSSEVRRLLPKPLDILDGHWGKVFGVLLGLLFGWFAITYGFWRAVFVAATVTVGYYIGRQVDERTDWQAFSNRLRRRE